MTLTKMKTCPSDLKFDFEERVAIKVYHGGIEEHEAVRQTKEEMKERLAKQKAKR